MADGETRLSALFGYEHVVFAGRARAVLAAVLDEVASAGAPLVMPSNICSAVLTAALAAGAAPRLAPVSPETGLADDARLVASMGDRAGVLMPVHGYGLFADYSRAPAAAKAAGWFVLENDSLGAASVRGGARQAFGDALLVSFGGGKTIDAGGGGAVLTDDAALAAALRRRIAGWPLYDDEAERLETELVLERRRLLAAGQAGRSEATLARDVASTRHRLPDADERKIAAALGGLPAEMARRLDRLAAWRARLAPLAPEVAIPALPMRAPWRAVIRIDRPGLRDRVVSALRAGGFDAGTNYPPLTTYFPETLAGQAHPDADAWGERVVTLWLDEAYTDRQIGEAVGVMERTISEVAG